MYIVTFTKIHFSSIHCTKNSHKIHHIGYIYLHFYRSHFIRTFAPTIKTNSIFHHDTFLPYPD